MTWLKVAPEALAVEIPDRVQKNKLEADSHIEKATVRSVCDQCGAGSDTTLKYDNVKQGGKKNCFSRHHRSCHISRHRWERNTLQRRFSTVTVLQK